MLSRSWLLLPPSSLCLLDLFLFLLSGPISLHDEAIADHKIPSANILVNSEHDGRDRPHRLGKAPKVSKPDNITKEQWSVACSTFVNRRPAINIPAQISQDDLDDLWNNISDFYEDMLSFAISQHDSRRPCHNRSQKHFKNHVTFSNHDPPKGQLDRANDTFVIRKLRNFSAKLRELLKLQAARRTQTIEFQRLLQKVRRNPFFQVGAQLETQLLHAEQALERDAPVKDKLVCKTGARKCRPP